MFVLMLATAALDMCAIAALVVGAVNHTLYAPLAVGYGITALAGVSFFGIVVFFLRGKRDDSHVVGRRLGRRASPNRV